MVLILLPLHPEIKFSFEAMQKIKVEVEWCNKNFAANLGSNVPGSVLVTAKTYSKLQKEVKEALEFHIEGMVALRELTDDYYQFDEKNFCVYGKSSGIS